MAYMRIRNRRIPLPASPWLRLGLGVLLMLGGVFSILPILGIWMLPVGLVLLSYDLPLVRRWRRRSEVAGLRWWRKHKHNGAISGMRRLVTTLAGWPFAIIFWTKRRLRHLRSQLSWYRTTRADVRRSRIARRQKRRVTPSSRSWLARALPFLR
jgi:hypothetical protein